MIMKLGESTKKLESKPKTTIDRAVRSNLKSLKN